MGNGTAAFGGDGGSALSAEINGPYHAVLDISGNMYIADYSNNRVRKVSTTGTITTIAGTGIAGFSGDGGSATDAKLNNPVGVIVDRIGNVYVADFRNQCIRKINTSGIISTIAGTPMVYGYGGDGGPATGAEIYYPGDIAIDRTGNLYLAEEWNNRIRKIDTFGIITTVAGIGPSGFLSGTFSGDGGAATSAGINFPTSVVVDTLGNIYFTDQGNQRIRKVNTAGIISTIAGTGVSGYGGDGIAATLAQMNNPGGIALDAVGNIYVGDAGNSRVRKIDASGIMSTFAGTGTAGYTCDGCAATASELNTLCGVFVDDTGNVYISDHDNNRIRKVSAPVANPAFISGASRSIIVCENYPAVSINSLLSVSPVGPGSIVGWELSSGPAHGSVMATFTGVGVSGSDTLTPAGLTYTPATGFTGSDSFRVWIVNGAGTVTDTIAIYVTVNPSPVVGAITGVPYVCMGSDTTYLADTSVGGVWITSNSAVALVTGAGAVYGVSAGIDTVSYILTNSDFDCSTSVMLPVNVEDCEGVRNVSGFSINDVAIYPNPNEGEFTVKVTSDIIEPVQIVITNLLGQKVMGTNGETNKVMDLRLKVPAGIYILSAVTEGGVWNKQVVVR